MLARISAAVRAFQSPPMTGPDAPVESPAVESPAVNSYGVPEGESFPTRRFDLARNTELDCHHWMGAHGLSINADLATDLPRVQARLQHLYTNNPYFRGVANTFAGHVAGRHGPRLQVQSDDTRFNDTVENAFKTVMRMPDPAGRLTGHASVRVSVLHTAVAGSSLFLSKTTKRPGPIKFGWQTVHPRRLVTPSRYAGDPNVLLGKRFDPNDGRVLKYYIDKARVADGRHYPDGQNYRSVAADQARHFFLDEEGEQATGVPLMLAGAKAAADVAEYAEDVMETAKNQAKTTWFLESVNPEMVDNPDPAPRAMSAQRGMGNVVSPGWAARFPNASQPMAEYGSFVHERLAELGRPMGMPLILVLLSSMEGNFSQAQFDGALYVENIEMFQMELERQFLFWAVERVITELILTGQIETRPAGYELRFGWDKPPHANLEKLVKSLRMLVEDGHIAPSHASAVVGYDFEDVVATRKRDAELAAEAGLPPAPTNPGPGGSRVDDEDENELKAESGKAGSGEAKTKAPRRGSRAASGASGKPSDSAGTRAATDAQNLETAGA